MHFFKKSISFIAVMCVFGAAYPAARVAMTTVNAAAARRLPTLANALKAATSSSAATATSSTTSSSTTVTGNSLLPDADCIDNYRDCMKSDSACGSEFEECTTNVLFHGHMSECVSTLYQCSPAAINRLFGTSNLNALSDVKAYVDGTNNTEIDSYVYPTAGSIMEIDISGAATRNKLSTADCVKKYKRCLNKDNVCGEDFELCTSDDEFKKQAAMCDSTLARCQKEGFQQIFGEKITTKPSHKGLKPNADGDARQWIDDGAALAAANAVNTCYKVVDTCFANACASNPYSCVEDVNWAVVNAAKSVGTKEVVTMKKDGDKDVVDGKQTATDVRKFFRAACTDTIGANQYCFMTFNEGKKPTKTDLQDEDIREDIFGEAYASRKTILTTKVNELVKQFDKTATSKCLETFKSCAVQSCGGGSGAVCYTRAFQPKTSSDKSINNSDVYPDIENGCAAVVNTDANCQFMAAMQDPNTSGVASKITNVYTSNLGGDYDAFSTLFPTYQNGNSDSPVVAALNAELSTAYNDVAIENMKKQCQTLVENCVKSMCGKDYMNCYRNRNDVYASVYNSGNKVIDKEMNKLGGVLDYTIVQGLCASTIRTSDTCAESLAIAKAKLQDGAADVTAGWGSNSTLTNAWRKSASMATLDGMVNDVDANGKRRCECDGNVIDICADEPGASNLTCTKPHRVSQSSLWENQAVALLFNDILDMVEREAQAQYNAKLTKEQNICLGENKGANPNPDFVWAKFKSGNSLPSDYSYKGLGDTTTDSNEIYNSFCRVKVVLKSDDKDVETLLNGGSIKVTEAKDGLYGIDWLREDKSETLNGAKESTVYFATGDSFTCGAWVSNSTLDAISAKVAAKARKEAGEGSQADKNVKLWTTLGVGALGTVGSYIGMNALQTNGKSLGGLLKKTSSATASDNEREQARLCRAEYNNAKSAAEDAKSAVNAAKSAADAASDETGETNLTSKQEEANTKAKTAQSKVDAAVKVAKEMIAYAAKSGVGTSYVKTNFSTTSASIGTKGNVPQSVALYSVSDMETLLTNLKTLDEDCGKREKDEETDEDRKSRLTNNLVAAGVGGVATTLLTNGIVSSAQKAKYENAANEAVKKWMDEIGSKIHCYVGGQLVGNFGDIVSISISEE